MPDNANEFLLGSIVFACCVITLFFIRFWRKTRDRLFMFFAIAFALMAGNWLALAFTQWNEARTALYVLRLLAFILILFAIYDKNRTSRGRSDVGRGFSAER